MTPIIKRILLIACCGAVFVPAVSRADIVFDPSNYAQAVEQVAQDVQLVAQFRTQIQNELAALKSWDFTALGGILQSMDVWQGALGGTTGKYVSTNPGTALNQNYSPDVTTFSGLSEGSYQSLQHRWDQEARQSLIENRTVQNDTYLQLAPTAERVGQYIEHSNAASGVTSAVQAGNEELATLIAQLQALQALEVTDARGEVERDARDQAEAAYAEAQCQAVRAGWDHPPAPTSSLTDAFPLAR